MLTVAALASRGVVGSSDEGSFSEVEPISLPAQALNPAQQSAVILILRSPPVMQPPPAPDGEAKKLHAQKLFIQSYAAEINKIICKKILEMLIEKSELQETLGIKLEKGKAIDLDDLLAKLKKASTPEDRTLKEAEGWCFLEKEEDVQKAENELKCALKKIYDDLAILLAQFDVEIKAGKSSPEFVRKPLEEQLQTIIEDYVDSKFSFTKCIEKGAPVFAGAWFMIKIVKKINSYGGFPVIYDGAVAVSRLLIG